MNKLISVILLLFLKLAFSQEGLVGHWTFDDPQNLLKAEVGADLVLIGSHVIAMDSDQKEAAIRIGVGSYYIVPHGITPNGGGNRVNDYTLLLDLRLPQDNVWHTIYQTDPTNQSDGDVFINPGGAVGVGATGYSQPLIEKDKWYRLVIVVSNGNRIDYYLDSYLALKGAPGSIDGRHSLASTFLLFADQNGEDNDIIVSDIKLFSRALTATEVKELGGFGNVKTVKPKTVLQPYLQTPTPTSIYVSWHDVASSGSYVEYGTTESLGQKQPAIGHEFDSQTIWNWSKLTGLSPQTIYFYKIVSPVAESEVYQFKTPPLPGTNSGHIRFGVMGDNRTDVAAFKRTIDKMKEKMIELYGDNIVDSINLVLDVGDIVTNGDVLSQYIPEYFEPILGLSTTIPFMVSIGNHEREAQNYYDYMKYEDFGGPEGEKYYSFQYGPVLFVAINSNTELRNETQINWLDKLLNQAQQDSSIDWIVSFCHHPGHSEIWPDGNTAYIQNRVIPTLKKYSKADILMYGHSHNYERGAVPEGNLRLMLTGGAGSSLDRWGMYANQRPYPEIQKSFDYYCYSIFDINIAAKKMTVKSYSLGHKDKYMDNVLFDEFFRDKSNELPPDKPIALLPENGHEVDKQVVLKSSPYSGFHEQMSSHFQVTTTKNDFSAPYLNSIRDFEDIYGDTGPPNYFPIDRNKDIDLTTFSFNLENIKPNTVFWWRVRYRDKNLQWSDWSEPSSFITKDRKQDQEPNDTPDKASKIFTDDTLLAELTQEDVDWYQFYLKELSVYYFASFASQPGVEPDLELFFEDNLANNLLPVSVKGLNDAGDFLLAGYMPIKSGTYFAKVVNQGTQTGKYSIRLSGGRAVGDMVAHEYDNTLASISGKPYLQPGDTLNAAIFPVDDTDYFKIQGQQGNSFEIGTLPILDLGNRDMDTVVGLMNESSEVLFENDNRGIDITTTGEEQMNTFSLLTGTFPYSGTFYIRVQARFNSKNDTIDVAHPGIGEYGVYFLTSPSTGVQNLVANTPKSLRLCQNYPNPFNPSTSIRFELPRSETINLAVYDTSGRRIKSLVDNVKLAAGMHEISWDGTDHLARQVASGLYFCFFSGGGITDVIKLVLIR